MSLTPLTMESLPSRLGSSSSASFSGRLPAPSITWNSRPRGPYHPIRAYQTPRGAQAIAITWDESYSDADWGSDITNGQAAVVQPRREFAIQQRAPKPLKINRDLLLYRARTARAKALRTGSPGERTTALREAEDLLRRCMTMDPTDGRPYVSLGKVMVMQRRYDEARKLYEDGAAVTGGTNAYIWAAWAYMEQKLGNVARARQLYDASTVADPKHAAAWHGWGLLEKQQDNVLRARDIWLKGVRATAASPNAYLFQSLAVLAADMGRTEEARKWFHKGTNTLMGQTSHALWQAWAIMESRQGDQAAVRYLFKRGLEASPRSRYLHLAWATWEAEQGRRSFARKLLQRGHEGNRRDPAILQAWALLEHDEGRIDEARRLFQLASATDPQHLYVWQAWGVMEYREGNLDRARELLQQGVWADPNSKDVAKVFHAWGVLEKSAGNVDLARELFRCAVKADPDSEPGWLSWALLEEDIGALGRAEELRSFRQQRRTEIVLPRTFADPDVVLAPVFSQIAVWFKHSEVSSSRRRNWLASSSGYLALDDNAKPATVSTGARSPAQWSDAPQSTQAFSTLFGGTEYQKMISLNDLDELEL